MNKGMITKIGRETSDMLGKLTGKRASNVDSTDKRKETFELDDIITDLKFREITPNELIYLEEQPEKDKPFLFNRLKYLVFARIVVPDCYTTDVLLKSRNQLSISYLKSELNSFLKMHGETTEWKLRKIKGNKDFSIDTHKLYLKDVDSIFDNSHLLKTFTVLDSLTLNLPSSVDSYLTREDGNCKMITYLGTNIYNEDTVNEGKTPYVETSFPDL